MASLCRRDGRLHAAGAAARDKNLLLFGRRRIKFGLVFPPYDRVQRTDAQSGRHTLPHAGEAAAAAHDLVFTAGHGFEGQIRVRQQRAAHFHDVGLAGGDDLLEHSGSARAPMAATGFDTCFLTSAA